HECRMPPAFNDRHKIKNYVILSGLRRDDIKTAYPLGKKRRIPNQKISPFGLGNWHSPQSLTSVPMPIGCIQLKANFYQRFDHLELGSSALNPIVPLFGSSWSFFQVATSTRWHVVLWTVVTSLTS